MIDVFTKIGGMLGLVSTICGVITANIQQLLYFNEIIKHAFVNIKKSDHFDIFK
jgi:hypothetical protein